MLLALVASFLLCNTLTFVNNIIEAAKHHDDGTSSLVFTSIVELSTCLVYFNAASSFAVYYLFGTKFRTVFWTLIRRDSHTHSTVSMVGGAISNNGTNGMCDNRNRLTARAPQRLIEPTVNIMTAVMESIIESHSPYATPMTIIGREACRVPPSSARPNGTASSPTRHSSIVCRDDTDPPKHAYRKVSETGHWSHQPMVTRRIPGAHLAADVRSASPRKTSMNSVDVLLESRVCIRHEDTSVSSDDTDYECMSIVML
jgi:hypothetical protein